MVNRKDSLILASGGVDSLVAMAQTIAERQEVRLLFVDYGQANVVREREAVRQWRSYPKVLSLEEYSMYLPVEKREYVDPVDSFYKIPWRNLMLIAIAAVHAHLRQCIKITVGVHKGDCPEYYDCRPEFFAAVDQALVLGDEKGLGLCLPNDALTKSEIVARGIELGVDFSKTWTCYTAGPKPCGSCAACAGRKIAFSNNKIEDPLYL